MKGTFLTTILSICFTVVFAGDPKSDFTSGAPLSFIENKGQITDQNYQPRNDIQFKVAAAGLSIFIGNGGIHYQFAMPDSPSLKKNNDRHDIEIHNTAPEPIAYTLYRMDVELVGANKNAQLIKEEKQQYYENYYTAATGLNGATANAYGRVTYKDVYPNIDWILYTTNGQLKHEFVVREGGRVGDIQIKYGGTTELKLLEDGSLVAITPQGSITEHAPVTYLADGEQVKSKFRLSGNELKYEVDFYSGILVIDPTLEWANTLEELMGSMDMV